MSPSPFDRGDRIPEQLRSDRIAEHQHDRIRKLAGRVMGVQEWRSLFSACRQLLPHKQKLLLEPSEVDLLHHAASPGGRVLSTALDSFSSFETYKNNQRYAIGDWISLIRDYYALVSYVTPPRPLVFAGDILRVARKTSDDSFTTIVSIVARNEPILVRQVASRADLDRWNDSLAERIGRCRQTGGEFQKSADEQTLGQDDFDSWYSDCEDLVDVAKEFYGAFSYTAPADLEKLTNLMGSIDRPADREDSDEDSYDRDSRDLKFWTVARMFEDL